jgi:hypothetical protein
MPYQIRIRRDSASNWQTYDPILGIGELGFDLTNNEVKVGDGTTAWTALTPIRASSDAALISGIEIAAGSPSDGDVLQYDSGTGKWTYAPMTGGPGGSGTVTSVTLTMPSAIFDVSTATITSSGTFDVTLDAQTNNRVFAGPTAGAAAVPTFRALVAADIPNLSGTYQSLDPTLTSISTTTTNDSSADKIFYTTGSKAVALTPLSSFARTLIDDADAAASRSTLGLGAITVGSTANTFDAIAWDTTPATTIAEAKLQWNTAYSTLELGLDASVTCKIGQGLYKLCHNNTGADINKGDVVFISGSLGTTLLTVAKARADAESTSATTVGVAAETFSHGTTGFIQVFGFLDGLTTNTISNSPKTGTIAEGDAVYLSESTAGGLRGLLPVQPNHGVRVGFLVKSAGGNGGSIFVNVQNYQELDELSDVYIPTTPANNDMLVWNNSTSRWENKTTATVLSNIGAAASSHTHGTISNDGKIGSDAGRVIVTTTNGALQALTDGSANYVLSTNGAGTLSWVAPSGGSGNILTDTAWAAKGDLVVGKQNDLAEILTVGTTGQVLTADSAQALGVKWADAPASVPDFIYYRLGII